MKIELKRKNGKKYEYLDIMEISGIPMIDIISREAMRPESCMKITSDKGIFIATDDMLHHTFYINRGFTVMSWRDGLNLLQKHYGEKLLNTIPEEVAELWPGSAFVGCDNEVREVA